MTVRNVLLDTNVLIHFEDPDSILEELHASVLRKARMKVVFYYHPLQLKELGKNPDSVSRDKTIARVKQFEPLVNPPIADSEDFKKNNWKNAKENDYIDNQLLWCIHSDIVDYLITEDKKLRSKARLSGLSERVFSLREFNDWLDETGDVAIEAVAIRNCKCHEIDEKGSFFDSLRESYGEDTFNTWWNEKCKRRQRDCWAIFDSDNTLNGLCVYKEERHEPINTDGYVPEGKVLKLCTFKIADSALGSKQGEKLLLASLSYAKRNRYSFVYFHADEAKHGHLVDLVVQFGFERMGFHSTSTRDAVYGKYVARPGSEKDLPKAEYLLRYYPSFCDNETVHEFMVPILPHFHEKLFPENSDFKFGLFANFSEMYSSESNAIRKAYICGARNNVIEPGDLLLFYRGHDRQSIDVLGAVIAVCRSKDVDEIHSLARRRTVYNREEIEKMLKESSHGELMVIIFDYIGAIDPPFSLKELKESGCSHPQSLRSIDHKVFVEIASRLRYL